MKEQVGRCSGVAQYCVLNQLHQALSAQTKSCLGLVLSWDLLTITTILKYHKLVLNITFLLCVLQQLLLYSAHASTNRIELNRVSVHC